MLILSMIFLHIIDDFVLQRLGNLAAFKQKQWWTSQKEYKPLYKYDYIVGLLVHSFSWAFMIMLPIAAKLDFNVSWAFIFTLFSNMIIHCVIDDLKANKREINLIDDQAMHLVQIIGTAGMFLTEVLK